jgi:hypothetical protein
MAKTRRRASTPRGDGLSEAATIGDVKRFLVRLIQRVDRGRITVRKANCMGQLANTLINAIVDHELEERIDRLEADRDTGWRTPREHTLTIRAGGSA